ncbi:MAG: hypothetical protein AAGC76_05050 [Luteibacter sp.]|uniref:hypothetical protein n=1 Tax=Luteibacter sp. TaxID=1886636 RepID=UPI002806BF35|nr:hypothetical protein [Luteibacter sp.]MDQ7995204.1 hypothetical protein [Luteibacter sp.]
MTEIEQVLRLLADAAPYKPEENPSATDRIVRRVERGCAFGFFGGFGLVALVAILRQSESNLAWAGAVLPWIIVVALALGLLRPFVDPVVRLARRRYRPDDEFHHSAARAAHREPQIIALAHHDDGVLEDREDEIVHKLSTVSSRLSVLIGERSSVVTTGAVLIAGFKVATELRWISAASGYSLYYFGLGAVIVATPALLSGMTERWVYRRELVASARKRKARWALNGDGASPANLGPVEQAVDIARSAANDG